MSENEMTSVNKRLHQEQQAAYLYCSIALEQVLCDIVAVKGKEYLDVFYERAVRRISDPQTMIASLSNPELRQATDDRHRQFTQDGEAALRRIAKRVEDDPTPVS